MTRKKESSFCEQKEAKKLYPFGCFQTNESFFVSFFSKKEDSSFLDMRR